MSCFQDLQESYKWVSLSVITIVIHLAMQCPRGTWGLWITPEPPNLGCSIARNKAWNTMVLVVRCTHMVRLHTQTLIRTYTCTHTHTRTRTYVHTQPMCICVCACACACAKKDCGQTWKFRHRDACSRRSHLLNYTCIETLRFVLSPLTCCHTKTYRPRKK